MYLYCIFEGVDIGGLIWVDDDFFKLELNNFSRWPSNVLYS